MRVDPKYTRRHRARHRAVALLATFLLVGGLLSTAGSVIAATSGIDVQLPLGHSISGVITSPTGDPVANADVNASADDHSGSARTAADGSYVIHALPDGDYRIFAEDTDGAFKYAYYGIPDSTPEGGAAAIVTVAGTSVGGIDIRLGAKAATGISGTIVDPDGHPVGGIHLTAIGEADISQATSAADGTYRVGGLSAGDYRLFVEPPEGSAFVGGRYVDGTVGGPEDEGTLVAVTETDATGVDIELVVGFTIRGHVTMARAATIEVSANGPVGGSAIVGPDGNFLIQGLQAGEYQIVFRDAREGPEQAESGTFPYGAYGQGGALVGQQDAATIDLTSGDVTLAQVHLPRGTDIVGQVTDGQRGLAGAFLQICDAGENLGCATVTGAADGTFRVVHVPTGSFTIFTSVPGRVTGYYGPKGFTIDQPTAGTVKVVSGKPDVKGIKIAVPAGGTVTGRITGPSNQPVVGARVAVFPFGIPPNWLQPISGADGRYRQTGIPTGEYGLSVTAPEGSDYLSGYYLRDATGHFTPDYELATTFRVIEDQDKVPPVVVFRDPASGATGVAVTATISVRFSEPVDGIANGGLQLRDPQGRLVAASVSFSAAERTAVLTPDAELTQGTKYKVSLTSSIKDWSGNKLEASNWSFTTTP